MQTQIDIYKKKAEEDEEEMFKRYQGGFETDDATLLFDTLNKTLKNTRSYNQFLNVLKHAIKEGKKRELETLYKTSDEKNNSSKLHHNRHRSRTQRERKFSLKSAMNATEKALTYNSKYRHRRNSSKIYSRRSSRSKKAFSRTGYVSK